MCRDLWITSLLFDLNYELINESFVFSPGKIYLLFLKIFNLVNDKKKPDELKMSVFSQQDRTVLTAY